MKQGMVTVYFDLGDVTDSEAEAITNNLENIMCRHASDLPGDIDGYSVQFTGADSDTKDN